MALSCNLEVVSASLGTIGTVSSWPPVAFKISYTGGGGRRLADIIAQLSVPIVSSFYLLVTFSAVDCYQVMKPMSVNSIYIWSLFGAFSFQL